MSRDAETDPRSRLLLMWQHPWPLSYEEATVWAGCQVQPLLSSEDVEHVQLTRLSAPTDRHDAEFAWLLELRLRAGSLASDLVGHPSFRDFLCDLRSLRLRPTVLAIAPIQGGCNDHARHLPRCSSTGGERRLRRATAEAK
jgi:hypothetical protein